jgi:hypothetical protein
MPDFARGDSSSRWRHDYDTDICDTDICDTD